MVSLVYIPKARTPLSLRRFSHGTGPYILRVYIPVYCAEYVISSLRARMKLLSFYSLSLFVSYKNFPGISIIFIEPILGDGYFYFTYLFSAAMFVRPRA